MLPGPTPLTAPELLAVVRVHADRLHDAVRRLGAGPAEAVDVVGAACLDLAAAAVHPGSVAEPVGWLFGRARALSASPAGRGVDLPLGGGVLGKDANQARLAEALGQLGEQDRAALLLRDSYDLPAEAVGAALEMTAEAAMAVVGSARLAFLPLLLHQDGPRIGDHPCDLAALARLAAGRAAPARDATVRRHAQSCDVCAAVLDAQERARRLLQGLTVVAMADGDREALLTAVERRSGELLPAGGPVPPPPEPFEPALPRRVVPLSVIALGVLLAVLGGAAAGAYASRSSGVPATSAVGRFLPLVTPGPVLTLPPTTVTPAPPPSPSPGTRVFLITPSPTVAPTTPAPSPSATPTPTPGAGLVLQPGSGPRGTLVEVTGSGFPPGSTVTLTYLDAAGVAGGPGGTARVDGRGGFATRLVAQDTVPGPHTVRGTAGASSASAAFTQTP